MGQYTISGAQVIVYLNEKKFTTSQKLSFSVDYGETPIFGIDSAFAQEIAPTKCSVSGSISGLRLRSSGGLQSVTGRPLITDIAAAPYISLRIQDRITKEDIIFIPKCKIVNENHSADAKGIYRLSFNFVGLIPLFALDRSRGSDSTNPASSAIDAAGTYVGSDAEKFGNIA